MRIQLPVISSGLVLLSPVIPVVPVVFDPQPQVITDEESGAGVPYGSSLQFSPPNRNGNASSSPREQQGGHHDWWSTQGTPGQGTNPVTFHSPSVEGDVEHDGLSESEGLREDAQASDERPRKRRRSPREKKRDGIQSEPNAWPKDVVVPDVDIVPKEAVTPKTRKDSSNRGKLPRHERGNKEQNGGISSADNGNSQKPRLLDVEPHVDVSPTSDTPLKKKKDTSSKSASEKSAHSASSGLVSEKRTPPKQYNEQDFPLSISKSSVSAKKSVAKKSVSEGATTAPVSPSPQRKMFAGAGRIPIQANESTGLFAGAAIDDSDDDDEDEIIHVKNNDTRTQKVVGNGKVLTSKSSASPSLKLNGTEPAKPTIQQGYASYQSGSLHRRFVVMPNFFVMPEAAVHNEDAVKSFREQSSTVKLREREDAVEANRIIVQESRGPSSARRFGAASMMEIFPNIARSLTISSRRTPLQGNSKDYQRMVASNRKKGKSRSGEYRSVHVTELPIAFVQSIPCYSAYVPVQRAVSCADDPLLRYVCYFGENDYEDVMADVYEVENVDTQGKNQSQERIAEMYEQEDAVIEQYLIRQASLRRRRALDKSEMDQLEKWLERARANGEAALVPTAGGARGPKDPSESDANESFVARVLRLERSLIKRMGLVRQSIPSREVTNETQLMDSVRCLFCRICFEYDCQLHGAPAFTDGFEAQLWEVQKQWAGVEFDETRIVEEKGGDSISAADSLMCQKALVVCRGSVTEAEKLLDGVVPKGAVSVTALSVEKQDPDDSKSFLDVLSTRRLKQVLSKGDFRKQFLKSLSYSETSKRLLQEAKQGLLGVCSVGPCYHFGPCTTANGCSCASAGSFCTKHCMCSVYLPSTSQQLCKNFFPGCRCNAGCETKGCPCHSTSRTCDPDLCRSCACIETVGSFEAKRPRPQLEDDDGCLEKEDEAMDCSHVSCNSVANGEVANSPGEKRPCQNRVRNLAHLMLAESGVEGAGFGIFARTLIRQGDMIAEYLGELVSQEEAERRGRYYDKVNRSYLFNVNADQVMDAFRKGNKIKFANHSKKPNCEVKILNVDRQQHILFFAKRNIEPGEELFFDYHYEQEQNSAYVKKNGVVVEWMRNGKKANSIRKQPIETQLIKKKSSESAGESGASKKKKKKVS